MRCNVCSRLMTAKNVEGDNCICGCRAFFLSRTTWYERIRFWLGLDADANMPKLRLAEKPIAGREAIIKEAWGDPRT